MSYASNTTRRSAMSRNNVMEVTVATAGKATSIIATTTSGRIAITVVIVATTTSAKRNRRTRLLLIAATRHSSHALHTEQRASTPPRSATRTPRTRTSIKPMTKNINMRRTTTMRITQVTTMSRALALIHQSQARTRRQPQARANPTRMRAIIFMLIRNWRQVAMCLASLTIDSIGASPSWVKRVKKEKPLLHSWMTILILWMPS